MKKIIVCLVLVLQAGVVARADDYFELRGGLSNSRLIFERSGKGRVVFLGGSITNMQGWRELVCEELQRRFPKTEFDFANAGIPSTGSTPGAFRLTRDVFAAGRADLLFEEAAVNDSTNGRSDLEQRRGMEGIVRHARAVNPNIDVVMMHFVDPDKMADYNSGRVPSVVRNHESVAVHYNVPSINLALEVTERIARGEFTWDDDFKGLHPSPFGHKLYSATIARLFDAAWSKPVAADDEIEPHRQPEKLDAFCYDVGRLVPPDAATDLDGFKPCANWQNDVGGRTRPGFVDVPMLVGEKPGDSFSFSFRGSAVGLFVAAGLDAGVIEYRVDGGRWRQQDLYTQWSKGLHIPWLHVLAAELDALEEHRLDVRLSARKNPESKGHTCRIVHFAVNGDR